jgi:hypothetical protein
MLKQILPKILKNTKFGRGYSECSYNHLGDFISFRRNEIIKDKDFNNIWQRYFNRKLSRKEILITSLLHELGHRKFSLENPSYNIEWERELRLFQKKYNLNGVTEWNVSYWQEIKAEKEAMNFAKEYFFRYKIKEIIKNCLKKGE